MKDFMYTKKFYIHEIARKFTKNLLPEKRKENM